MPWLQLRPRRAGVRRVRLSIEMLDGRVLCDGTLLDPPDPPPSQQNPAPPQIVDFRVEEIQPGWYQFTGTVIAENPNEMVVSFGGDPVSLHNVSVPVRPDGTFILLIQLRTDGSDDGTATAMCTDQYGQQSNIAATDVTPSH